MLENASETNIVDRRDNREIFVHENHQIEIEDLKFGIWSKWDVKLCDDSLRVDVERIRTTDLAFLLVPILNVQIPPGRKKKEKFYSPRMDYARSVKMIV